MVTGSIQFKSVKIPSKNKNGDCYQAAGRYFMDNAAGNDSMRIVHGEVTGQGAIEGIKYGHAWVEDGSEVIDTSNGRNLRLPKEFYYMLGKIERTVKYDYKEFTKKILETSNWGPWDLKTQY